MLWQKAWLETRGRFLAGLAISVIVGFGVIYDFRATERLLPLVRNMDPGALDTTGPIGAAIKEGIAAQQTFRGFVWWQWYRQNLTYLVVIFGALLGAGGLLARSGGATLFTLSLPVSRNRLIGTRAVIGLAELLAIAIVPSLVLPLLAPSIGQSYSVIDVMVHVHRRLRVFQPRRLALERLHRHVAARAHRVHRRGSSRHARVRPGDFTLRHLSRHER